MAKWSKEDLLGWILVPQRSQVSVVVKEEDLAPQEALAVVPEEEEEDPISPHQQEALFKNFRDKGRSFNRANNLLTLVFSLV